MFRIACILVLERLRLTERIQSSPREHGHCPAVSVGVSLMREGQWQNYRHEPGTCPLTLKNDCCCMVTLVNTNGLEAYILMGTGSTTLSITHNFTQVAKLRVSQLENPVPLQLGMIGSWLMINFSTQACLELGPIIEDNVYLDVVNLDHYDMVIGTPFICKHSLMLDFKCNVWVLRTWLSLRS